MFAETEVTDQSKLDSKGSVYGQEVSQNKKFSFRDTFL